MTEQELAERMNKLARELALIIYDNENAWGDKGNAILALLKSHGMVFLADSTDWDAIKNRTPNPYHGVAGCVNQKLAWDLAQTQLINDGYKRVLLP